MQINLWMETASLSVIAMELLWIVNWYFAIVQPHNSWLSALIILGITISVSFYISRTLAAWRIKPKIRQGVFGFWMLICFMIGEGLLIYPDRNLGIFQLLFQPLIDVFQSSIALTGFIHLVIVILLILRGVTLSQASITAASTRDEFVLGLLAFGLYGFGLQWPPEPVIISFFIFLLVSLVGLTAARICTLGEMRGGRLPIFTRGWAGGISGVAAIVVILAIILGLIFGPQIGVLVKTIFFAVFQVIIFIAVLILSPILLLFYNLLLGIIELLKQANLKGLDQIFEFVQGLAKQVQNPINLGGLGEVLKLLRPIIILVVLIGLIWLVIFLVQRSRLGRQFLSEENSEILRGFRFPSLRLFQRGGNRSLTGRRLLAAFRIRWAYAQLMTLADRLDHPRLKAVTPLEFLPEISGVLPTEKNDLEIITQAYVRIRYGEIPETHDEVNLVMNAWSRVNIAGKKAVIQWKQAKRAREKQRPEG